MKRVPRFRAYAIGVSAVLVVVFAGTAISGADVLRQLTSDHFRITYTSGTGDDAVSPRYARLVQTALETAYDILVEQFALEIFPGRIAVDILETQGGEMGTEYLLWNGDGTVSPVIEIATERQMEESLDWMYVNVSMEDAVLSTAAHELFHVIQDTYGSLGRGDISEETFVEAHATAVQEIVAPDADDYLDPAIDLLFAPDSVSLLYRRYDAGIFWVFVADRYGGLLPLLQVMTESAVYDGVYAADRAFAAQRTSFLDVWLEFAIAFATDALPDQGPLQAMVDAVRYDLGLRDLSLPIPVHRASWTGTPLCIDRVNVESPVRELVYYVEDETDVPLRVAHAYGIDMISISPRSNAPLAIRFEGDPDTGFRTACVARTDGGWEIVASAGGGWIVDAPAQYSEIRVVLTRGEAGSGAYTLDLSEAVLP